MFVGERLTLGTLISGALATQPGLMARTASTAPLREGSGNVGFRGRAGSNTLLGPEETGHGQGCCRLVVALVPAPCLCGVGVCLTSCGTGLLSNQLMSVHCGVRGWVLVAERVWLLFVV